MITMITIQKIDKDLKKPGLVWSSTGGVPISASSLGSAGADALDDGFFGAIQWQDYARDTCQDSCATRASQSYPQKFGLSIHKEDSQSAIISRTLRARSLTPPPACSPRRPHTRLHVKHAERAKLWAPARCDQSLQYNKSLIPRPSGSALALAAAPPLCQQTVRPSLALARADSPPLARSLYIRIFIFLRNQGRCAPQCECVWVSQRARETVRAMVHANRES